MGRTQVVSADTGSGVSCVGAGDPGYVDRAAVVALSASVEEGSARAGRVDGSTCASDGKYVCARTKGAVAGTIKVVVDSTDSGVSRVSAVEPT